VEVIGPVWGKKKERLLAQADLFVLPTLSENFGIVVAEALAHAVPVLTTTGAPWRLLVEEGCGWWVAPTIDGVKAGLAEALAMPTENLRAMGKRGRTIVAARFSWDEIAQQMVALYTSAEKSRADTAPPTGSITFMRAAW
jgi:glycosyltransferase involved in cell wall biosynthesis